MSENNQTQTRDFKLIPRDEAKGKTFKLSQLKEPGFMEKVFKNAGEYLETK
jgi:hypothetical protein